MQQFRLTAALIIALAGLTALSVLAIAESTAPESIQAIVILAVGFLFGTATNGSGMGGAK